jgi:4a-hydroxytetrahydrobiopterin dehydratase
MAKLLTAEEIQHLVTEQLSAWNYADGSLFRSVEAPTFMAGIRLVEEVASAAEELDHHPDIDIRWTTITFRLSTHSARGVTENDVQLAERIDEIAAGST